MPKQKECKVVDGFKTFRELESFVEDQVDAVETDTFQDIEGFEGFGVSLHYCNSEAECQIGWEF
jgi:hypothetical protein